jgi:AbiV family abortive infection protein
MAALQDPPHDDSLLFLAELKRGGELAFANAQQLFREGKLLREHGAIARAACLHQLSNEECGKVELLGWCAMSSVLGRDVDRTRLSRVLRDHKAKNYANAYFSGVTHEERAAREQGNWGEAREIFHNRQGEIHELFNTQKNAALYVNFENEKFSAPEDVITEALADEMAVLNEYFLSIAGNSVRLLGSLRSDSWGLRGAAQHLLARFEELRREQPDDPERAFRVAKDEMFSEVLGKLASRKP